MFIKQKIVSNTLYKVYNIGINYVSANSKLRTVISGEGNAAIKIVLLAIDFA